MSMRMIENDVLFGRGTLVFNFTSKPFQPKVSLPSGGGVAKRLHLVKVD